MPEKYFRRTGGEWTSSSGDVLAGLAGARLSTVQAASWALRALLEEGADPEWAERVIREFADHRRGEGWARLLLRLDGDDLERWGTEGAVLGKLGVGEWQRIVSRSEARDLDGEVLENLVGALQTYAVAELTERGEAARAAAAMTEGKWFLRRTPDAALTAAMMGAPPPVREKHAAAAAAYPSWIDHAVQVALAHPSRPPPSLAELLHRHQEEPAYLTAAMASPPPVLTACREATADADCCRAFAVAAARREWAESERRDCNRRRWEMKDGGYGELAVGKYPPEDQGWELIRRLPEGAWEWRSEVWQGRLV